MIFVQFYTLIIQGMNTTKIIDRVKNHSNLTHLSLQAGVSRRTLNMIRAGCLPSVRTLAKIEAALWPKKIAKLLQAPVKEV